MLRCSLAIFISCLYVIPPKGIRCSRTFTFTFCGTTLGYKHCPPEGLEFSRTVDNKIVVDLEVGTSCVIKSQEMSWVIKYQDGSTMTFQGPTDKETFTIAAYSIGFGEHMVQTRYREIVDSDHSDAVFIECKVRIVAEIPIPVITGGNEITVMTNRPFSVDGSKSIDTSVPPGETPALQYTFSCTVEGPVDRNYCDDLESQHSLDAPSIDFGKEAAKDGLTYTVTLSVKNEESGWQNATQIIHVKNNKLTLSIRCNKNCHPAVLKTDSRAETILSVECVGNCDGLYKFPYVWTVDDANFNYETDTFYGNNGDQFYIKENILQEGRTYKIEVEIKGSVNEKASIDLHVKLRPKLKTCTISPPSGIALKTRFSVSCDYDKTNDTYLFEIYQTKKDSGELIQKQGFVRSFFEFADVLLCSGADLEMLTFSLGIESQVKVKMIDESNLSAEKIIDVQVTSVLANVTKEDLKSAIDNIFFGDSEESVKHLVEQKKYSEAIQTLNGLADEMSTIPDDRDVLLKLQAMILNKLDEITRSSDDYFLPAAAIANKIVIMNSEKKSDPDISKAATDICKDSAEMNWKQLKEERYPQSLSEENEKNVETLSSCSQASINPNEEIFHIDHNVTVPPTAFPLLDVPVISEDYPDYIDDQNISKILQKYELAAENLVNICFSNAKSVSLTMVVGENTKFIKANRMTITSTKKQGNFGGQKIISDNIELLAPADMGYATAVDILMCTCTTNPFWWIRRKSIETNIAIIEFNTADKIIDTFVKPFSIIFEIIQAQPRKQYTGRSPRSPTKTRTKEEYDFERIALYKIDVFGDQGYYIEFFDLVQSDNLNVIVSYFEKPTAGEFLQGANKITIDRSTIHIKPDSKFDSWHYLYILPDNTKEVKEYRFAVYTAACFRWNGANRDWEIACLAVESDNSSRISCLCYTSSIIAGRIVDNGVKEERTIFVEHELEVQASLIIFISVAVVFFIYCLALSLLSTTRTRGYKESTYFLGDIPNNYRYGYLVIVKTGSMRDAGTTSNVSLKLFGSKSESKEHVLNYPDPQLKMLQQHNEDWFFLATEHHLGDLVKLEIWFDSIGYKPKWYCEYVEVIDVQTDKYWLFKVNFLFEIITDEKYVHVSYPWNEDDDMPIKKKDKLKKCTRGHHMWNIFRNEDEELSKVATLTIMLSVFMVTYTTTMLLYGWPTMQSSDSLSLYNSYVFDGHLAATIFSGGILSLAIHTPLVFYTRYMLRRDTKNIKIFWCILIPLIVLAMTLLIIFGFWVPYMVGLLWLTSVIISLLIYIFLFENIIRYFHIFFQEKTPRPELILKKLKLCLTYIELQRSTLYKTFGKRLLRPYFGHLYSSLDETTVKERKRVAMKKEVIVEIVENLVMIGIYVILLYTIILKDRDTLTYRSHLEVKDVITGVHSRTVRKNNLRTRIEIEDYLTETLIYSLQSLQWYGKYVVQDPGMTIDHSNKYLGIARFRQHRSTYKTCIIQIMNSDDNCTATFSEGPDYTNYGEGWDSLLKADKFSRMVNVWIYKRASETGTWAQIGKFASYPGGGFVATLGRNIKNSLINMNYLSRNRWIDGRTRCGFVEFLLYSPNSNLFNAVRISFEISTTGFIKTQFNVDTANLLFAKEGMSFVTYIILICFVLAVVALAVKALYKIRKRGKLMLSDIWFLVDIIIVVLSLTSMFLYIYRANMVKHFLEKVEKAKNNEFINYFHLFYAESVLTALAAILVFVATLRLWKLLKFLKIIRVVEKTLLISLKPLLCLFLCHLTLIFYFTMVGIMFFGDQVDEFKDIGDTIITLLLMCLNLYFIDLDQMRSPYHFLFYFIYYTVHILILNVYITLITISYDEAQKFYSNDQGYSVFDYLGETFIFYCGLWKVRLRGCRLRGGDENTPARQQPISPKEDVHRYAKCLTISTIKMRGMLHITLCILRNMRSKNRNLDSYDEKLLKETIVYLFRKETQDKELFYECDIEGFKLSLVDDLVFVKMAKIVGVMLTGFNVKEDKINPVIQQHTEKLDDLRGKINIIMETVNKIDFENK